MKSVAALVLFFAVAANSQQLEISWIPCVDDDSCKHLIDSAQNPRCINALCLCLNTSMSMYQKCHGGHFALSSRQNGLKHSCANDSDCDSVEHARCRADPGDESRKICDCADSMVASSDNSACLAVAASPQASCDESVQCKRGMGDGGECYSKLCRCRPGYHFGTSKKQCIADKAYGEECHRSEESCFQLAGSEGKNALGCSKEQVCKCIKHYSYVGGKCIYSSAPRAAVAISALLLILFASVMS